MVLGALLPPMLSLVSTCRTIEPAAAATTLAEGVWAVDDFVTANEAATILDVLPHGSSDDWHPCPLHEAKFPVKQCVKLGVERAPVLAQLGTRLSKIQFGGKKDHHYVFSHVAVTYQRPSSTLVEADDHDHEFHTDGFAERAGSQRGPATTSVLYLTEPPTAHPANLSGALIFPNADLELRPQVGRLVAWANRCTNSSDATANGRHGIGAMRGADLPPRISLTFAFDDDAVAFPEHIGRRTDALDPNATDPTDLGSGGSLADPNATDSNATDPGL